MERLTEKDEHGNAFIVLDENSKEWSVSVDKPSYTHTIQCEAIDKLAEYEDAEEQGLLLRLPCRFDDTLYWVIDRQIKEVWFKGIRCDKGYMPQIIARYMVNLSAKEEPITKLENLGKTVFFTREEAEKALEDMKGK